jgi:tetratricopeptide (TPR) repeat protein
MKKNKQNKFFPEIIICVMIVLASLIIYLQVQKFEFVDYDDDTYIFNNNYVKTGLSKENIVWAFTSYHSCNWHPITWLSHMIDSELFGSNAGGHHLTNLFLHIVNCILLFFLMRKITGKVWQSALVAALVAVHPLNVESVAWVSERKNILSTFLGLLTIMIYFDYIKKSDAKKYLLLILFFSIGLMSKPMLITLPFTLLLFDFWPLKRIYLKEIFHKINYNLIIEKIPLFLLVIISSIVTILAQKSAGAVSSLQVTPIQSRLLNVPISYVSYFIKMLWPHKLAFFYPYPENISILKALLSILILIIITIFVKKSWKKYPYIVFGWLWYIGTLIPVIGLIQVGSQAMADRYAYLSLIGIFIIIAYFISDFSQKWSKQGTVFAFMLLSILIPISKSQTGKWQNSETLFKHAIKVTKNNYLAHNNLASYYYKKNRIDEAIRHYSEALKINPYYAYASNNLGAAFVKKGEIEKGIPYIIKAIKLNPNYAEAYNNLGIIFGMQGNVKKAITCFSKALQIQPDYIDAKNNLKIALEQNNTTE